MIRYVAQRLLALLPTVLVPVILVFALIRLAPGDPASVILGDQATPEQVTALREQLGLNAPLAIQFGRFLRDLVTLDLGESIYLHQPVVDIIPKYAAVTIQVGGLSLVFALLAGVTLGALAAFRRRTLAGRVATGLGMVGISVPQFWLALVLILVFAVRAHWFNVGGYVSLDKGWGPHLHSLVLPALSLGLAEAGFVSRITRGAILDVVREPFIVTARSLGVAPGRINVVHVMRLSSLQVLTVIGLLTATLISGSVVIESIFGLPGMGRLLFDAVQRRDYQLVQGIVIFTGLVVIVVNLATDVLYAVVDPRVQYGKPAS